MKGMYYHSYGSIPERGPHKAKKTIEKWIRKDKRYTKYCLSVDIDNFYPTVNCGILKNMLRKHIKDYNALSLIERIIDVHDIGTPMGLYSSPWLANFYLQEFDHFVKEQLHIKYYARYTDDMLFFGNNKRKLHKAFDEIVKYLKSIGLTLNDDWQVFKVDSRPVDFVGYVIDREQTRIRKSTALRMTRRIRKISKKKKLTYVATQSQNLNVRSGPGTNYKVVRSLEKGSKVLVTATSGSWSKIGNNEWVSTAYLSAAKVTGSNNGTVKYRSSVGKYYRLKSATTLYSKGNLTGAKYSYKAKTQIKVISHYTDSVDYVYVVKTGRYAYCSVSAFSNESSSKVNAEKAAYKSVIGKSYRLKSNTTLYSNGNLTGTKYQYLAKTEIIPISHYSADVDYIRVVKTGRCVYVPVSKFC